MNYNDIIICPKCKILLSRKRLGKHREKNRCVYQHGKGEKSKRT